MVIYVSIQVYRLILLVLKLDKHILLSIVGPVQAIFKTELDYRAHPWHLDLYQYILE